MIYCVLVGVGGFYCAQLSSARIHRVFTGFYCVSMLFSCVLVGFSGLNWVWWHLVSVREFRRVLLDFTKFILGCTGLYWVLLGFFSFHGVCCGFWWILVSVSGFRRVLLDFKKFYRALLDITGFYQVLIGFTGFYWVSMSFTRYFRVLVLLGFTWF